MSGTRKVARSALTGRFVPLVNERRLPWTTVVETYYRRPVRRTTTTARSRKRRSR